MGRLGHRSFGPLGLASDLQFDLLRYPALLLCAPALLPDEPQLAGDVVTEVLHLLPSQVQRCPGQMAGQVRGHRAGQEEMRQITGQVGYSQTRGDIRSGFQHASEGEHKDQNNAVAFHMAHGRGG